MCRYDKGNIKITSDCFSINFLFLVFPVPLPLLCACGVGADNDEVEDLDQGENRGAKEEPKEATDLPEQTEEVEAGLLLHTLRAQAPIVNIDVQKICPKMKINIQ